jgi:hypothetical protein
VYADPGDVAFLWLSPEALFEDKFHLQSMLYAFGWILHELFTKGCEPFTEMTRDRDDILRLVSQVESSQFKSSQVTCD